MKDDISDGTRGAGSSPRAEESRPADVSRNSDSAEDVEPTDGQVTGAAPSGDKSATTSWGGSIPARGRARSGTVYLVGAGPGDPDLLTVRARWLLETADVICHDALVRNAMVESLPANAEILDVGKRVEHKTPQSVLNRLLVERAREGEAVVRLKGGDPFVFGRGGEELRYLAEHGVPTQVVPGVSSVVGAPGIAGIPLTHRDVCSRFTVITGHETPDKPESALDWDALATDVQHGGTLVVLMGVRTLERNVDALTSHGVPAETPIALVEKASWDGQQVIEGTLATIVELVETESVGSPATAVIGDVAALREGIADQLVRFDPA